MDNHWCRASSTSGSLPSRFRFWDVPCFPSCVHSSRSLSCWCIKRALGTPVISARRRWLVLGKWLLIWSSKAIFSASDKSLRGILVRVPNWIKLKLKTKLSKIRALKNLYTSWFGAGSLWKTTQVQAADASWKCWLWEGKWAVEPRVGETSDESFICVI
jgi:hypothetical protein